MQTVAALFVDPKGVYSTMPGVECWDIARDARTYAGPHPVVAHPPCERWGRFAKGSPMLGGKTPGDDGGCFHSALESVRWWGGVIEHPAHSLAWDHFLIPSPRPGHGWIPIATGTGPRAWTCHVEQGHYGHGARKATWLFYVGNNDPAPLIWGQSPQRLPAKRLAERGYESARRCGAVANMSHRQRQLTPPAFAEALVALARSAR